MLLYLEFVKTCFFIMMELCEFDFEPFNTDKNGFGSVFIVF